MRASVLRIVVTISLAASLGSVASLGQEKPSEVTVEEIVSRHEATWEKFEKLVIKGMSKRLVHRTWLSNQENGRQVEGEGIHEDVHEMRLFLDGTNQSLVTRQIHEAYPTPNEEREWRVDGIVTQLSRNQVNISHEQFAGNSEAMRFGRSLNRGTTPTVTTLQDWVKQAKPTVEPIKNEQGEECWQLKGKFHNNYQLEGYPPVDHVDDLSLVVNANRGYLIERMEFVAAPGAAWSSATWGVSKWYLLPGGVSFPAKMRMEMTGAKAKKIPNDDGKRWSEFEVVEVTINPPELEKSFEVRFRPGTVVYDHTKRPGTTSVAIWGEDNKPKQVFATLEDYQKHGRAVRGRANLSHLISATESLFPGCEVKGTYDESADAPHIVIRDPDGTLIREFRNEEELRTCALSQMYIGQLLQLTRRR